MSWTGGGGLTPELRGDHDAGGMTPDVLISFPAERIYFPLKPTAAYGGTSIPIRIYVLGLVEPELYPAIDPYSSIGYFSDRRREIPPELAAFYEERTGSHKRVDYTKIAINAPSDQFADDLWIGSLSARKVNAINRATVLSRLAFALAFVLLMPACALVSALLTGGPSRPPLGKLVLMSFSNCFTLVGFLIVHLRDTGASDGKPAPPTGDPPSPAMRVPRLAAVITPVLVAAAILALGNTGRQFPIAALVLTSSIPVILVFIGVEFRRSWMSVYCTLFAILYMAALLFVQMSIVALFDTLPL